MLSLTLVAAWLSLASTTQHTQGISLVQCERGCQSHNNCHASLESLSCEASCQAVCKCDRISRRMLNKPKHCMATMLEEHHKRLSLFRMGHPTMKKVVLKDDQASPDFTSYVPLEDFWPGGHPDEAQDKSKPVMLNSKAELSLLRKSAMPWSPEHRSLGSRSKHHHRHHRHKAAAFVEQKKNASQTEKTVPSHKEESLKNSTSSTSSSSTASLSVKALPANASKTQVKASTANASKAKVAFKVVAPANATWSNVTTKAKPATSTSAKSQAKVVSSSNSSSSVVGSPKSSKAAAWKTFWAGEHARKTREHAEKK